VVLKGHNEATHKFLPSLYYGSFCSITCLHNFCSTLWCLP